MKKLGTLYGVDIIFDSNDEHLYNLAVARLEYLNRVEMKYGELKTMQEADEFLKK